MKMETSSKFRDPLVGALAAIAIVLIVGLVVWLRGPNDGDKYTDVGNSVVTSAGIGLVLVGFERIVDKRAQRREAEADEQNRFVTSLLAADDLTGARLRERDLSSLVFNQRDLTKADLTNTRLVHADLRKATLTEATLNRSEICRAPGRKDQGCASYMGPLVSGR